MAEHLSEVKPAEIYVENRGYGDNKLIIGSAALEHALESGVDPRDIAGPLSTLLTAPERPVQPTFTEPLPAAGWDSEEDVTTAIWLDDVCRSDADNHGPLHEEAIVRAGYLGIVPRITYFKNRPGRLVGLYAEAQLKGVRTRSLFDSWAASDFVGYLHDLAKELGRRPKIDDIKERAEIAGNPSLRQIGIRFGRPGILFEMAGWPEVRRMETDDFIDWGVMFMEANDGTVPTSLHLKYLSKSHRGLGPGPTAIYDHDGFTSLLDFQTRAIDRYSQIQQEQNDQAKLLKETLAVQLANGDSMVASVLNGVNDDAELLKRYSRHLLIQQVGLALEPAQLRDMCKITQNQYFVDKLMQAGSQTLAQLETAALALGIYEYIWPTDHSKSPLRIENWDQDEWDTIRKHRS